MKIKLAILESDECYLNRLVSAFSVKYAEKIEIYAFTDKDIALDSVKEKRLDIFIVNESFDIDTTEIPQNCGFAYFVEAQGVETIHDQYAICKFQKADLIYKQIVNIYSEKAGARTGFNFEDSNCKVLGFASPCGGTGNTTIAVACAQYFARTGKKVLYLNLETFGCTELMLHGEGTFNMSDIIFALKSNKTNFALKLESCVKRDSSGVYFFDSPNLALDLNELNTDEILKIIDTLTLSGSYEYIIIDMEFTLKEQCIDVLGKCNRILWVSDGMPVSNCKINKAYEALELFDKDKDAPLIERLGLIYNRFDSKKGKSNQIKDIEFICGIPKYSGGEYDEVARLIASNSKFTL